MECGTPAEATDHCTVLERTCSGCNGGSSTSFLFNGCCNAQTQEIGGKSCQSATGGLCQSANNGSAHIHQIDSTSAVTRRTENCDTCAYEALVAVLEKALPARRVHLASRRQQVRLLHCLDC
ncbi:hypothetical protein GMRT_20164 [Giardia muris]|uniref:Uncharacterized protein n=1 Tax=Giardia muris TaxID=5742 RepID=A0A4Z1T108_GIAMU|nr:hypothetical protein GMRT_20164 [Giardia muris]|eukprot:TNJ29388.1 hypothetical protein GMRT_20164 [Giardia muris]